MQRPLSMPSFRKPMLGYVNMDHLLAEKLGMDMKSQYQVIGKTGSEAMLRRGKAIKALQSCDAQNVNHKSPGR
ncbi:hypothetical protein Ahy_A02g009410 isoform A [Arachis hypogaea]|uniref:Uncharacterized protein n=1 Tax=Arachis hypogaea TaxID=3818 RepID=A0A445EH10_ARAHY|nr:hypothetical protein Ahy_A02g009410 isoform A [Arachis hypogaea]